MLSTRLQKLCDLTNGTSAIDIGSDHAYVLIELANEYGFNKMMAVEVNKGPFDNSYQNIKNHNLSKKIKVKLSNGLQKITINEAFEYENIIIAGMGGDLILSIIKQDIEKFKFANLILQPNNNEYKLRKFLLDNGFNINEEYLIKDSNKFYEIITAKHSNQSESLLSTFTEENLMFGKYIKRDENFKSKWENEFDYLNQTAEMIKKTDHEVPEKINNKIKLIKEELKIN